MGKTTSDIVALHALPRAGKDTVADALTRLGMFKLGFGDELYVEVARNFGVSIPELRSHGWKTQPQALLSGRCCDSAKYRAMLQSMGVDMAAPQTSRFHLRMWATEYRRHTNPLYWVTRADAVLRTVRAGIVINDLRFADTELPYLKGFAERSNRRLRVIEITRDNTEGGHVSDLRLPDNEIDFTIHNIEGNPAALIDGVMNFLGYKDTYDHLKRTDAQADSWSI